jgi:hypothetical protein
LLEREHAEQLEGLFDIRLDGTIAFAPRELGRKLLALPDDSSAGSPSSSTSSGRSSACPPS